MIISIELFAKVKVDEAIPQTVISVGLAMERVKTIIEETKVFAQKWAASGMSSKQDDYVSMLIFTFPREL